MVAPARDPRRAPHRTGRSRPDLRVVGRGRRTRRPGWRLAAGLLALFLALFTNAVAHSVLVSGQERLDGLNARLEQAQADNQRLHLRAAELESPQKIVEQAKHLGLIQPEQTEWLAHDPDDGTVEAGTVDAGTGPTGTDAGTEELAGSAADNGTDSAGR